MAKNNKSGGAESADWRERLAALLPDDAGELSQEPELPASQSHEALQTARLDIVLDRKGRAGKSATIISGFTIGDDKIDELASKMKRRLACGGSVRGGEILLQGDRRRDVLDYLTEQGYKARVI